MAGRFVSGPVQVRVPATSANLGPGFDSFGLALSRYDDVTAEVTGGQLSITAQGEGAADVPLDADHLIARALHITFERLDATAPGVRLDCVNRIPHGRGLGSSAAAIVAGVELARALVVDGRDRIDDAQALALAAEIEGHPDNVAACQLGGFTLAWTADRGRAVRLEPSSVRPVLLIPPDRSATTAARAALPPTVPHADAAFNAARAALLVAALTGRPDLLWTATEDRLHQQYRAAAMPASIDVLHRLRSEGTAAVISGAGSSVLALLPEGVDPMVVTRHCPDGWEPAVLAVADGVRQVAASG
jgi:homoserine kinase